MRPAHGLLLAFALVACTAEPEAGARPDGAAADRSGDRAAEREAEFERLKAELRAELPQVATLSVEELAARLEAGETPLLLDVRARSEFDVSHLRGAHWAESPAEAEALLAGVPPEREVIVYCSIGYRSAHMADALGRAGRSNVRNLEGSIFEWANTGHAVWRDGERVREVHPYDAQWGRLLDRSLWAGLE